MKFILLFTVTFVFPVCCADFTLRIDYDNGRDDSSVCLKNQLLPCKTLDFVSKQQQRNCSNLNILIVSNRTVIADIIYFENCNSLIISGSTTTISCDKHGPKHVGFQFKNVTNLTLTDMMIESCGYAIPSHSRAAMYIHRCINVTVSDVKFNRSSFTALVISNTLGVITIKDSQFLYNKNHSSILRNHTLFPGGVHIQFNNSTNVSNTKYTITNCHFENNRVQRILMIDPQVSLAPRLSKEYGYGLGGGMAILFMSGSHGISVIVEGCSFVKNKAHSGAGLYVHFEDNTTHNNVTVIKSNFSQNEGTAGGGLTIGMSKLNDNTEENSVFVAGCQFINNSADYGGGTAILLIHGDRRENMKLINFHNCTWKGNFGNYSSAVDVLAFRADQFNAGYMPTPRFTDCIFAFNWLHPILLYETNHIASGVFVVSTTTVYFGGDMTFLGNSFTALKMTSGRLRLEEGTKLNFSSNLGSDGAAVAMYGFSSLVGNKDCLLYFYNNSATSVGGGIFYDPIEQREFIEGKSCFLLYQGPDVCFNVNERNLTFVFVNNSAPLGGSSIYALSLYSCFFAYYRDLAKYNLGDFLYRIGNFTFNDTPGNNSTSLGTIGTNFKYYGHELSAIPGQLLTIPLSIRNEFNYQTHTELLVKQDQHNEAIFSNNVTRVFGKPNKHTFLFFRTNNNIRNSNYTVKLNFVDCPPGYYFDPVANSCNCTADNSKQSLGPIVKCYDDKFRALIVRGYWAGMYKPPHKNGTQLYVSSHSELTYMTPNYIKVSKNHSSYHGSTFFLPKTKERLASFMCGEKRSGVLCGECSDNYSAYYHSSSYTCGPEDLCSLGIVFYILSELIPVVTLFSIIIHLDTNFGSGYLNGLIFYCQIVDAATINYDKLSVLSTKQHTAVNVFQSFYKLIYGIFNFEFFHIEPLSYCLWKHAIVMDAIAIKYVTTLFTFILIFVLVRIMNCQWSTRHGKKLQITHSVTKGLSVCLILCYSQCTKITFQILSREMIVSNEGSPEIPMTVHGGLPYFGSHHLKYALPALVCLLTLVFLPLVYLFLTPLLLRVLMICDLSEHTVVRVTLKILCHQRLMPLFDVFQSCFKPKLSFFAGIYFVYRAAIFAAVTFSKNETQFYTVTECIFLVMLGLHAITQPYKLRKHNVIDGMLLLNLAAINSVSIIISISSVMNYQHLNTIIAISIQLILVMSPMIVVICRCIWRSKFHKVDCYGGENYHEDTVLLKTSCSINYSR